MVVSHAFSSQHSRGRSKSVHEFPASLVYRSSSKAANATQSKPWQKQTNKPKEDKVLAKHFPSILLRKKLTFVPAALQPCLL